VVLGEGPADVPAPGRTERGPGLTPASSCLQIRARERAGTHGPQLPLASRSARAFTDVMSADSGGANWSVRSGRPELGRLGRNLGAGPRREGGPPASSCFTRPLRDQSVARASLVWWRRSDIRGGGRPAGARFIGVGLRPGGAR